MKLNVYQEQHRSEQASHTPREIGFGYDIEKFKNLGKVAIDATQKKLEQDDELNSARIEADTMLAAQKMLREYESTANPENFVQDTETQKENIQNLISQNSQKFKTPKMQRAFQEQMTRSLEENYMKHTLAYGYALQEEHYKNLVNTAFDPYNAMLLEGDTLVNVQDVLTKQRNYRKMLEQKYSIPRNLADNFAKAADTKTVVSFATGMINKDPEMVMNLLAGDDFDKFKASKEALGQGFSIEEFWNSPELQEEYNSSEYAAKWTELYQYVDYPTRLALWKEAYGENLRRQEERVKQKIVANSVSGWEIDKKKEATIAEIKASGKMPTDMMVPSSVDYTKDPGLGSIGNPIRLGNISKGRLEPGNSYAQHSIDFARGISGQIEAKGYYTKLASNVRPKDTDSRHRDGSAVDLVFSDKNGLSLQGTIDGYKAAISQYGNSIKKKGVLLEIRNRDLPKAMQQRLTRPDGTTIDVLDFLKQNMQAQGVDTSWINWEQSRQYRDKASGGHVHFTINAKDDYTKTNVGEGKTLNFRTPIGEMRYMQKRADGKSVQDAYDAARQDELEILTALQEQRLISGIISKQNSDGSFLDPSYYGRALQVHKQEVLNNKKLSDTDRIIALSAIEKAEDTLPKLQEQYRESTVDFMLTTRQARTPEEAQILQVKRYGIAPEEVVALTDEEAKTKANQLYSKLPPDKAVDYLRSNAVNPATLRQIAKYMPDDSKSDMLMYSPMASDAMASTIIDACKNWEDVKKAINQDKKMFPTMWEEKVIGDFKRNPVVKKYFKDISKTSPQEAIKMLSAMKSIYAYRMYAGGTNSKGVIDDIAKNLIANNFNSITVDTPRQGRTDLNIAKVFSGNDLYKIQRVSNMAAKIGPSREAIFVPSNIPVVREGIIGDTVLKQAEIDRANWLNNIEKTTTLSGTYDGLNVDFTWEDSRGIYAGAKILSKDTRQPLRLPCKDMKAIYDEAYKLKETWKIKGTNTYNVPTGKYSSIYGVTEARAQDAAIEHVLTNKYKWLNKTDYTQLKK